MERNFTEWPLGSTDQGATLSIYRANQTRSNAVIMCPAAVSIKWLWIMKDMLSPIGFINRDHLCRIEVSYASWAMSKLFGKISVKRFA